ncbi:MAG: Gfo/Idh/MocA family oxidoreductase [Bacteroidaceae bacterium]|nr:Gfo/Idh/MocA family oxidoreductase [Bacteroidaceae bacterium]
MKKKIKMGMLGGGPGSFIGPVHRMAANLDGLIELVCGCFSSDPAKSAQAGEELCLPKERVYTSYQEMIEKEILLPADERMDFLSIVTPNHLHYAPAAMALEAGFHVALDKPITYSLEEVQSLAEIMARTGKRLLLTHTYSGYPLVKEARYRVQRGDLGKIRRVYVEYPQGWLSTDCAADNKQASWRVDPSRSGKAGCMGDIGTHAFHLAKYITGLEVVELCAELNSFVLNRQLDDDGTVMIRYKDGARCLLSASQVCAGVENGLYIRIYGEKGGLEWRQDTPNTMIFRPVDGVAEIIRTATSSIASPAAQYNSRIPGGHPEGYIEAFANLYRNFALTLMAEAELREPSEFTLDFPSIEDGIEGMQFIDAVVASSAQNVAWVKWQK